MIKYQSQFFFLAVLICFLAILPGCESPQGKNPEQPKTPAPEPEKKPDIARQPGETEGKSPFDRMIVTLAQELHPKENMSIVIGAITRENTAEPSALSSFIIFPLENNLLARGATITRHNRLAEILATQKMQFSALFDQEKRPQLGKWLAVQAMVFGKVFYEGYQCRIVLELVAIEFGTVKQSSVQTISCGDLPPIAYHQLQLQCQEAAASPKVKEEPAREHHFMGVPPFFSPEELHSQFTPLLQYLSSQTGVTLELKIAKDYDELVTWLREGSVSFAHLSPYPFIRAAERGNIVLLAGIVNEGAESVRSIIVTHAKSGITNLKELQGRSFAFVDTRSTSGFIYPRMLLIKNGCDPARFLGKTVFAGDHLAVISAVLSGKCDAGAVYDGAVKVAERKGYAVDQLKILSQSELLPPDPYVSLKNLDPSLRQKFTQALFALSKKTSPGKEILAKIGWIEGWKEVSEETYSQLRDYIYYGRERARIGVVPVIKVAEIGDTGSLDLQELLLAGLTQMQRFFIVTLNQVPAGVNEATWISLGQEKNLNFIVEPRLIQADGKFSLSLRVYECKGGKLHKIYMTEWRPGAHQEGMAQIMRQMAGDHPLAGFVIENEKGLFRIDLGQNQGLQADDSVEVYKLGEEKRNQITGEVIGVMEKVVAKGKVVEVFYDTASCRVDGEGEAATGYPVKVYSKQNSSEAAEKK
jgi:phosphate/phosphite/phosphonate ABC transporter binding protein